MLHCLLTTIGFTRNFIIITIQCVQKKICSIMTNSKLTSYLILEKMSSKYFVIISGLSV